MVDTYLGITEVLMFFSGIISVGILLLWLKEAYCYYVEYGDYEDYAAENSTNPIVCVLRSIVITIVLFILSLLWIFTLCGIIFWAMSHYGYIQRQKQIRFINILKGKSHED